MTAVGLLPSRDRAILADLARVRLLTGSQLDRLHFAELSSPYVRSSVRRRTLGRLQKAGLVTALPRRVGGERAGSAGLVFTLDAGGQRLVTQNDPNRRQRRPWVVGQPFVQHTLDIAELYVRAVERNRDGSAHLVSFRTEPLCWYRTPRGVLKPDAYLVYVAAGNEEHRWIEVDRSTESVPTLAKKLTAYLDAVNAGAPGPDGVFPVVVVTVIDVRRRDAVERLISNLPEPASALFHVQLFDDALSGPGRDPPRA